MAAPVRREQVNPATTTRGGPPVPRNGFQPPIPTPAPYHPPMSHLALRVGPPVGRAAPSPAVQSPLEEGKGLVHPPTPIPLRGRMTHRPTERKGW